jgi:GntR family transcriptional regulator, transcriptional repressor for pyruvate dehydrogenase complex
MSSARGAGAIREERATSTAGHAVDVDAFRPVGRRRLADDIVRQIRRLIVVERLEAGARLPSERQLAERCGSSRAVVAQALRTLALMGLVEIRPGSGAYVLRDPASMVSASFSVMVDLRHGSLESLCQLRLWLERLGAAEALHAGPVAATVGELDEALGRLGAVGAGASTLVAADTNFHARLVAGAANPYLTTLYESVHTAILEREYEQWVRTDDAPEWLAPAHRGEHLDLHRAVRDSFASGEAHELEVALGRHHRAMLGHLAATRGPHPSAPRD